MWIENVAKDYKQGIVRVTVSNEKAIPDSNGYMHYQKTHETRAVHMTEEIIGYKVIVLGKAIEITDSKEYDELKKQFAGNADVRFEEKTRFITPTFQEILAELRRQDGETTEQEDDRGYQPDHGRADYDTADMGFASLHSQAESYPENRVAAVTLTDDDAECIVIEDEPGAGWTDPTCDSE